jgi:S-adenosylmethionine synthetase
MISDALLDAYLRDDPSSHVAVETMASEDMVFIAGEVSSTSQVDVVRLAREVICGIGYDSKEKGINGKTCKILTNIGIQSPDIAQGVNRENGEIGAGDQGMMYGYACDDTPEYMPLSISLAHQLCRKLTQLRKEGRLPYLYPDGKSQVTVAYDEDGNVQGITDIVISTQHNAEVSIKKLRSDIEELVIRDVIPARLMLPEVKIHINPTGRFVVGGPEGDVGLTGRKIIVDTYGGIARHGGGAFSGKDPTKVDRSAAYMARYAAKNIVAAGFCKKCEVNLAYAIGVPQPVSIKIDTFGTEEVPKKIIEESVKEVFDFSVAGIIRSLSLTGVTYKSVAAYGHFGRDDLDLPWERIDKAEELQDKATVRLVEEILRRRNRAILD